MFRFLGRAAVAGCHDAKTEKSPTGLPCTGVHRGISTAVFLGQGLDLYQGLAVGVPSWKPEIFTSPAAALYMSKVDGAMSSFPCT